MNIPRRAIAIAAAGILSLGLVPGAMAEDATTRVSVTLSEPIACNISTITARDGKNSFGDYQLSDPEQFVFSGPEDDDQRILHLDGTVDSIGQYTGAPASGDTSCSVTLSGTFPKATVGIMTYHLRPFPQPSDEPPIWATDGVRFVSSPLWTTLDVTVTNGDFSVGLKLSQAVQVRNAGGFVPSRDTLADVMVTYTSTMTFTASPDL